MRTVVDIYEKYRVPPWLQMHQLRVAGVGKFVTGLYQGELNVHDIISACLLHDIGAIVKFDFDRPLAGLYPADKTEYWRGVQRDMHEKYGTEEHAATGAILEELGVAESVQDIIHNTGFRNMRMTIERGLIEVQVVQYSDMRVALHGVTSFEARLADLKERYAEKLKSRGRYEQFDENFTIARDIEEHLFKGTSRMPEEITDASVTPFIEDLKQYEV